MVIYDEATDTCDVYEIKQSTTRHPAQLRFLLDEECQAACERVVAPIRNLVVLYGGEPYCEDGVIYENVADYLMNL